MENEGLCIFFINVHIYIYIFFTEVANNKFKKDSFLEYFCGYMCYTILL